MIEEGKVKVNGKLASLGDKCGEEDKITVSGKAIKKDKKLYLMFNKPLHCVTALEDMQHRTVIHYINIDTRVFPIGRLDYNTTGLLLLTNDGDFANSIMHPRYEIKKTYRVEVDREFNDETLNEIISGVDLEDGKTAPAEVSVKEKVIEITIHEGRNRIIRRMLDHLGFKVISIERIKIGSLSLGSLKRKEFRKLSEKDKEKIFD